MASSALAVGSGCTRDARARLDLRRGLSTLARGEDLGASGLGRGGGGVQASKSKPSKRLAPKWREVHQPDRVALPEARLRLDELLERPVLRTPGNVLPLFPEARREEPVEQLAHVPEARIRSVTVPPEVGKDGVELCFVA